MEAVELQQEPLDLEGLLGTKHYGFNPSDSIEIVKKSLEELSLKEKNHLTGKITELINAAFKKYNKKLDPEYFELIEGYSPKAYLAMEGDRVVGVAITYNNYLCKFAVDPDKQGEGVGEKLFNGLVDHENEKIAWRVCQVNNESISFYEKMIEDRQDVSRYSGIKEFNIYSIGKSLNPDEVETIGNLKETMMRLEK